MNLEVSMVLQLYKYHKLSKKQSEMILKEGFMTRIVTVDVLHCKGMHL